MGYQQKSYKKFIATAATATLVASAIVPVASASFSDVADTHEFAGYINKAVEAELIKGYADGTFGINDNLKRSQVVLIIGRYLEKLGYTSKETTSPWLDVKDEEVIKYGNIVKEAGVFTGYADGTLKGGSFITRENMAVVLDRLAEKVTDTSFSKVAEGIEDKKIADLATANADYQASIQALRDLGISTVENFNPKGNVKRGQFAKFIVTAVEKINEIAPEVPEAPELVVESVNAINAITVVEGTDVHAALPKTVEATVVDSKDKVTLDIKWTAPEGFEGKDGEYTFTGTVSSADEKVVISEDKATVTVKVTIDKTAPTIESVKVNGTTATYDKGVITLTQGSAVDSIEITMSEAVVLPADLNVLFDTVDFDANSGAPTDFEGRAYGTVSLKEGDNKTIIIKPSENNGVAAYVGTVTFKLSGTVKDLVGNAFSGAIPTLQVTSK